MVFNVEGVMLMLKKLYSFHSQLRCSKQQGSYHMKISIEVSVSSVSDWNSDTDSL